MMDQNIHLTKKDALSFALLGIFCLFVFREIIFQGHFLFGTDFFSFYLGMKQFLYDEIHLHHTIPYWNPYVFGGIPFWAHFESTIFYPLDILFWFMPPERAYGYTVFFHVYLAGAFTFLFCRSVGIRTAGALVSALCFMFSGMMMATIYDGQMFRVQAFTWFPLVLFFVHRALSSNEPLFNGAMAGLSWGIQIMSGAPQDALYTLIAAFLFILFMWDWNFRLPSSGLRPAKTMGILFLVGLGIAAVQIVPSYEFVLESVRRAINKFSLITMGSYPPEGIITWLLPHFYGRFAVNNYWVSNVPWSVPLYNLYVGVLPVFLLLFISLRDRESRRTILFALTLAGLSFLLALGSNTPLYELVVMLPGFDMIRAPAKIIILWALAMALLAGKGMDGLFSRLEASSWRHLGVAFGIVLSIIALDVALHLDRGLALKIFSPFFLDQTVPGKAAFAENIIRSEWHRFTLLSGIIFFIILPWTRRLLKMPLAATLLCSLLFLDLAYVNRGAVRHDDRIYTGAARVKEELGAILGQDKSVFRVGSFRSGWGANFEMYLGYQSVGGYNPLFLQRYYEYLNQYRFYGKPIPEGWIVFFYEKYTNRVLMDLLNVKYEISHTTKSYAPRNTYLPRAYMVPDYKLVPKEELLNYLIRPDFDPTRLVLFESEDHPFDQPKHPPASQATQSHVEIISSRPDSMVLETNSSAAGFLFISEIYYPGWKALVDGKPVPILRGNYLFRVIELPPGTHSVQFYYAPLTIKMGIAISVLTLVLMTYVALSWFRRSSWLWRRQVSTNIQNASDFGISQETTLVKERRTRR